MDVSKVISFFKKIWAPIQKVINWFASSADNSKLGPSGRKLTAITFMALIIHGHLKYVDAKNYYNVLLTYEIMIAVLLGIVTVEQIIIFFGSKTKNNEPPKQEP
jgi:hypothetical protein